jgi:hypothetical protein
MGKGRASSISRKVVSSIWSILLSGLWAGAREAAWKMVPHDVADLKVGGCSSSWQKNGVIMAGPEQKPERTMDCTKIRYNTYKT